MCQATQDLTYFMRILAEGTWGADINYWSNSKDLVTFYDIGKRSEILVF